MPNRQFVEVTPPVVFRQQARGWADVETAYKTFKTEGGDPPQNVRAACRWTWMCERSGPVYVLSDFDPGTPGPQPDIHPSNKGYKKVAGTHADLIDNLGILD